jgi:hypothetical protein
MPRHRKNPTLGLPWTAFYRPEKRPNLEPHQITIISWGPEHLGLRESPELQYGPAAFTAAHPELFATGTTSADEGWFYWGCLEVLGEEGRSSGWQYQKRVGYAKIGGATVDFVLWVPIGRPIACRIVTPYFHEEQGPEKAASDREQVGMLDDAGYDTVDAFSRLYMQDPSGVAVKDMVKRVIQKDPSLVPGSATYLEE